MPVSNRNNEEQSLPTEGSSGGSGERRAGRKSKSRPTTSRRNRRQKVKERYAKYREEAQLLGLIPTTPEGALRQEAVDPASQGPDPTLPGAVVQALKEGWKVPEEKKQDLVEELIAIVLNPDMPSRSKIAAFNALRQADRLQWEQDNPVEASKTKGAGKGATTVSVSVQANHIAASTLREMFERELGRGETALPPPIEPSPPGYSRFDGEVEVGAAPTSDE